MLPYAGAAKKEATTSETHGTGTHIFTCFTSAKVQVLTPEELRDTLCQHLGSRSPVASTSAAGTASAGSSSCVYIGKACGGRGSTRRADGAGQGQGRRAEHFAYFLKKKYYAKKTMLRIRL
jgi:hypothetical protein